MRAVVIHEHGGPAVLTYEPAFPDPEPRPGKSLVRVAACGLSHLDVFVRRGTPGVATELPHISGGDVVGTVVAHGPDGDVAAEATGAAPVPGGGGGHRRGGGRRGGTGAPGRGCW